MPQWISELITNSFVLMLIGIIAKLVYIDINKLRVAQETHEARCHELPKAMIMQRLEDICEKIDRNYAENEKVFEQIKADLRYVHGRLDQIDRDLYYGKKTP